MNASEARAMTAKAMGEYGRAIQWIKNAALRGESEVSLSSSEFSDLTNIHNKLVVDGYRCILYRLTVSGSESSILDVRW